MKLLYCAHGDNYHITKWVRALDEAGADIHLATFQPPVESNLPAEVHLLPTLFRTIRYIDFPATSPRLRSLIRDISPNLVFASFANTYGLMAALTGFRPLVVQTWSRDIGIPEMQSKRELLQNKLTGFPVLRRAGGITTDGHAYKDRLLRQKPHWKNKTLATPWGIRISDFDISQDDIRRGRSLFDLPESARVVSAVRGVYWYYQPEAAIKGIMQAVDQSPGCYGLILTLNQERDAHIQQLLDDAGCHDRIRVIDRFLDKSEIRALWAVTDVFLSMPINDGVSEAVSEGRYCRAIPVLNPIASNLERAEPDTHALYLPEVSPEAGQVAHTLLEALTLTVEEQNRIHRANREWVKKHASVEHTTSELIRFFNQVLNQNDSRG